MAPHSPNKVTKEIELEGQTATLAVDLNFFHTVQRITGRDLLAGGGATPANQNTLEIKALIFAAMRSGKSEIVKGLSDDEGMDLVGDIVHPGNLKSVSDTVLELMQENSPKADDPAPLAATDPVREEVPIG